MLDIDKDSIDNNKPTSRCSAGDKVPINASTDNIELHLLRPSRSCSRIPAYGRDSFDPACILLALSVITVVRPHELH